MLPYARQLGLHPVIEDTPNLKLCLEKADEVKEVLDAVEGLELVYDSGNMILDGEDPVEMLKKLEKERGITVKKVYDGIYYFVGDVIPIQLILIPELSSKDNYWMKLWQMWL